MTKDVKHRRIVDAAIQFVYDGCANSLAELEDAVTDLIGVPVGDGIQVSGLPVQEEDYEAMLR